MSYHWPKGVVSYLFDDQSYDDGVKDRVQIAMAALERDSCIRFKEQKGDGEGSWLHFTNPGMQRNCSHDPSFQKNGEIQVTLGYDCLRQRDIMHSLLHGVGFRDEISHPQRDLFVKIMWGNIQSAYKSMFRIQPVNNAGGLVEYDPMSIMHFHDRAYSLNGQATITPLLPGLRIAPSDKLSHLDKMKLGIMFGHECNKRKVGEVLNRCKGILTQFDEAELTTTKPVDDNTPNNEDVNDDGGNHEENTNASGNNGDQKDGHEPQELIVVGNDVNSNHEGDPIASDNNNGDQKGNGDGSQEMIIVGNEEANGNINDEDDVDNNQTDNPENVDPVEDKENSNTIEKIDIIPNEEVIIVGSREDSPVNSENAEKGNNDNNGSKDAKETDELIIVGNQNKGGDVSDDNNQDTKGENEIIVVGNEHKGGNEEVIIVGNGENKTGPKDLKERIMKKRN
ncbi:hypothetical protein MSG28_005692 [Choristoneura fumiferana]|uniref:Uncharacterized protein n=2 Tax=Choristoneura fumiferana TaxID=7141 RepID=A0ACC0L0T0_CHOFU|nr:hypothetical protein MSG28_005692 [Choristoneura fumiferana]